AARGCVSREEPRARGSARLAFALLAPIALSATLRADELHLRDGTILQGRLESDAGSSVKFVEAGKKKSASFDKSKIARIVLTYALPDFVYSDPKWSPEMVDARTKQAFTDAKEVKALRSAHYIVFTNASAGEKYLEAMEDVYTRFRKTFPFEEPKAAPLLPIFLFKTTEDYFEFCTRCSGMSLAAA